MIEWMNEIDLMKINKCKWINLLMNSWMDQRMDSNKPMN